MIKALFLDIDGTLLSFKTHSIPPSAVAAINAAQAQGVKIIIATGRAMPLITVLDGISPDGYITTNGCNCFDAQKRSIYKCPIRHEDMKALVAYLEETGNKMPMAFCADDRVFLNTVTPLVEEIGEMLNIPIFDVEPLAHALETDITEIIAYFTKEEEQAIFAPLMPHCEFPRWHPKFTDIVMQGHNKQTGIDRMTAHFGIDLSETMAIGDGGNDIEMLQHAAIGVAMGNATEVVKAVADYVTAHVDEDGLAKAIEHFILRA